MKVLVAHNAYQWSGGEDAVVDAEVALLRRHGHDVVLLKRHNDELESLGRATAAAGTLWSSRTTQDWDDVVGSWRPDVLHVHNFFPLISPSLHWAASRDGVAVVQTLHNFRLMCPQAMFLREGRLCEDCLGKVPWRGVLHACYRGSRLQSAALAGMIVLHRGLNTWQRKVDRFIALSQFSRVKFIEGGLPAERVAVKPNFVDFQPPLQQPRAGFLFVGRLSVEKGISTLLQASRGLPDRIVSVAGTGPELPLLDSASNIDYLGSLAADDVRDRMQKATALVLPSIVYENFPRTLVEAYASGLPVVASRIGALAELVDDGKTGLLFDTADADDLGRKLRWALDHPDLMDRMGREARTRYEALFSADHNHTLLMEVYEEAMRSARSRAR